METGSVRDTYSANTALANIWLEHHRYLLNVAYRMLGSVSEAEDIIQDAFARMLRMDISEINDVRGWLVVAVTRRCLDELRSARSRREVYVGPWLPEPVIEPLDQHRDPADLVTLDDSVRMAMMLVLERLSPAERVAFILHDVFQFSFDEVAEIVGRTPSACRQLASRARRHVQEDATPARFTANPEDVARITDRFIAAVTNGDLQSLMLVLDPNVVGHTDSGGVVPGAKGLVVGRQKIAPLLMQFMKILGVTLKPMLVNGEPGLLAFKDDRLLSVIGLSIKDGLIVQLHGMANPYKLAYAASLLDVETVHEDEHWNMLKSVRRNPNSDLGRVV